MPRPAMRFVQKCALAVQLPVLVGDPTKIGDTLDDCSQLHEHHLSYHAVKYPNDVTRMVDLLYTPTLQC